MPRDEHLKSNVLCSRLPRRLVLGPLLSRSSLPAANEGQPEDLPLEAVFRA